MPDAGPSSDGRMSVARAPASETTERGPDSARPGESDPRRDLRLFVGRNDRKFLPLFDATTAGGRGAFVCWSGFFFPVGWFLYRKMYGYAALSCLVPTFVSAFHVGGGLQLALSSAPSFIALAGRRIYVGDALRTIARIRKAGLDESDAERTIQRAGGVSYFGAVVGGLIFLGAVVAGFQHGLTLRGGPKFGL